MSPKYNKEFKDFSKESKDPSLEYLIKLSKDRTVNKTELYYLLNENNFSLTTSDTREKEPVIESLQSTERKNTFFGQKTILDLCHDLSYCPAVDPEIELAVPLPIGLCPTPYCLALN